MSALKSQGISAFIWHFIGKLGAQGSAFIVSIFLARLLEPAEFGLVAMVSVLIGMAQIFTDVGLCGALAQRRRVLQVHYSSVFYFNICVASFLSLLTFLSASWIADYYKEDQLVALAQVMSLSFVINALGGVQTTKFRKELNFALLTKIRILSGVVSGVIGVYLAFSGAGVWSLVAQSLSAGIIYNLMIWISSSWRPSLQFSLKALMQLWGYGSRMFLAVVLDTLVSRMDVVIIGKLFDAATLGLVQRARGLTQMVITYSSGALIPVLFPVLSKVQNNLPRFQRAMVAVFGIVCFIVFLLLGCLYLVSEELIIVLFTEKWLPSAEYLQIMLLSGFEVPAGAVLITVLSSRGNSKDFLRLEIYKKVLFVANLGLLFSMGIKGYLYGLVVVSTIAFSMDVVFASREIKLPMLAFVRPFITQLMISVISVIGVFTLMQMVELSSLGSLLLKASLYMAVYVLLSMLLKTSSYRYLHAQLSPEIKRRFFHKSA